MTDFDTPIRIGPVTLPHRFALSPMTRSRAEPDGTPGDLAATYYTQRASLGLLISEGTQPSDDGQGYTTTPGIYTGAHVEGWRRVSDAVHDAGAHLFIQLMHAGRMSHPDNTPHHRAPVAPSAISAGAQMFTPSGPQETPVPRSLSTDEVEQTVSDFARAAASARRAGADGVELHGASSYLIHQFLAPVSNVREDRYGGSVENRARFALEVARAVADEIGADRTGIRISPSMQIGGVQEPVGEETREQYRYLVSELSKLGLAYLHVFHSDDETLLGDIRRLWTGPLLVVRAGRTRDDLTVDLESGLADIVPIGSLALANPDFVERFSTGAPMNEPDRATMFGGDGRGYTDYPTLADARTAS